TLLDGPDPDARTVALDINNRGQVVGSFRNPSRATNTSHGFVYDNGRLTPLDVTFFTPPDTTPRGINARGQVVGSSFEWLSGDRWGCTDSSMTQADSCVSTWAEIPIWC